MHFSVSFGTDAGSLSQLAMGFWLSWAPSHDPANQLPSLCYGEQFRGLWGRDAHAMPMALGDASTYSLVEDWLTQQHAVQEVLAAIPGPTVQNTCVMWLSKGSTSRQGSEVVKGVGAQLPTKNFCLLHSPKMYLPISWTTFELEGQFLYIQKNGL